MPILDTDDFDLIIAFDRSDPESVERIAVHQYAAEHITPPIAFNFLVQVLQGIGAHLGMKLNVMGNAEMEEVIAERAAKAANPFGKPKERGL